MYRVVWPPKKATLGGNCAQLAPKCGVTIIELLGQTLDLGKQPGKGHAHNIRARTRTVRVFADLPLASAGSDMIGWGRVLLSHTLDTAHSY